MFQLLLVLLLGLTRVYFTELRVAQILKQLHPNRA